METDLSFSGLRCFGFGRQVFFVISLKLFPHNFFRCRDPVLFPVQLSKVLELIFWMQDYVDVIRLMTLEMK